MSSEMYVALSGQMAMQERLITVAHNVANMRTAGFRAETVDFDTIFSDYRRDRVAFASPGTTHIDRRSGPVEATGNPLDVAIAGNGWFGIETPSGRAYTRDGRFTVSPFGELVSLTGHVVVDDGGAPIQLDPDGGRIVIGVDGRVEQDGNLVGVLGLFEIPQEANLTRYGDSAVLSDLPAEPVIDRAANGVRQGFQEGSNVDPMKSIVELIAVQRAFEHASTVIRDRQSSLQEAVRILGATE